MPISLGTTTVTALFLGTTSISSAYLGNTQVFGGSFTPLSLFSGGAQGIWLDPSDLTTMFSDRAGTIPVTTPGTVVGKRLDKSGRGNHATAPTDAARPVYGVEPKGGRRNNITFSEDYSNVIWQKARLNAPTSGQTDPVGGTTAQKLVPTTASGSHAAAQYSAVTSGLSYTFSVYLKASGYSRAYFNSYSGAGTVPSAGTSWYFDLTGDGAVVGSTSWSSASIQSVGSDWYRCRGTFAASATGSGDGPGVFIVNNSGAVTFAGDGTSGILIWGAQLELGSTATAYQRVTTAYEVTESGVATCHYVQYDGSDDSLSTAAIDFTATDKMSVFAGVRKLGTVLGVIVETGTNSFGTSGSFALLSGAGVGTNLNSYALFGTGSTGYAADFSTFTVPISNVLTGQFDIAQSAGTSEATLRADGAAATRGNTTGTTMGTGNFGNYAMFFGRRNNATIPFNGRDYGIIVVGKTASAGEITDTETWLAARTSGVSL